MGIQLPYAHDREWRHISFYQRTGNQYTLLAKYFPFGSKPLKYGLIVLKKCKWDYSEHCKIWILVIMSIIEIKFNFRQIYICEWCQYVMMDFCSCISSIMQKKIGTIKLMFTIFPLHVKLMIFIPRVQINSLGKFKFSVKHDIFIHRTTRYCRRKLHINN